MIFEPGKISGYCVNIGSYKEKEIMFATGLNKGTYNLYDYSGK